MLGAVADREDVRLGGIDLDTCRDPGNGEIEPWALEVIKRFGSYTEISPSGTGVKVFFAYRGDDLDAIMKVTGGTFGKSFKGGTGEHPPAIECYFGERYFTVHTRRFVTLRTSCAWFREMIFYGCFGRRGHGSRNRRRERPETSWEAATAFGSWATVGGRA